MPDAGNSYDTQIDAVRTLVGAVSVDRKGCCGGGKAAPTTTLKLTRDVYVFDLLSLASRDRVSIG